MKQPELHYDPRHHILRIDSLEIPLTHPDKVIFHQKGYTKMDLIRYYLEVRERMMHYAKGRPLSMKRFPEGCPGNSFFQRNKPAWAPKWIHSSRLGIEKKADYILPDHIEVFIWLTNLGVIEFHAAQVRQPHLTQPDVLVFDLDPPPGQAFAVVRDFALEARKVIESFGYTAYVKTSGKKGAHILCPVKPLWSFDQIFEAARDIGEEMIRKIPESTLRISKKIRKNKILVDIYRNHSYQSMVLPYTLRATQEASVSMPLHWKSFAAIDDPKVFHMESVLPLIVKNDPWRDFYHQAAHLHTEKN